MNSNSCYLQCNQYWASSSSNRYDVYAVFRNIEEPTSPKKSSLMLAADEVLMRDPTEVRLMHHWSADIAESDLSFWFITIFFPVLIDPENQQLVSVLQRVCWEYRLRSESLCWVRPKERVLRWGIPPLLLPGICQHVSQTRSRCVQLQKHKLFHELSRLWGFII